MTKNFTDEHIKKYIDECNNVVATATAYPSDDRQNYWSVNMYNITDILIREVGRRCDAHGSDMLITLDSLNRTLSKQIIENHHFVFAIRKNGVDGIGFLQSRVSENSSILYLDYYRAIFAVRLSEQKCKYTERPELKIELVDISNISTIK